jgi:glycosyltransferase involved in cell wall biosynthesis
LQTRKKSEFIYLTCNDPLVYRRPFFVKRALPQTNSINYTEAWRTSFKSVGRFLNDIRRGIRLVERKFFRSSGCGGDYFLGTYYYDFLNYLLLIKKLQPHVVITLNTPLCLGAKMLGGDVAVIVDWMDVLIQPGNEMNLLDVKAVERADAVIFWSRPFMEIITKRLKIRQATYIPEGVDLRMFDPLRQGNAEGLRRSFGLEEKFIILYSGGLFRMGGVELQGVRKALEAFSLCSAKLRECVLVLQIFNYDAQLLKDIRDLGIRDRVVLIGKLPSYSDQARQGLFSASNILVLPASRHPTIYYAERMKIFQYMAAAKPIIAEETPGTASVLGEAALYAKLGDTEEMADAMLRLYEDEELRAKLGGKARQRVESQYEWSVLIPRYKDFVLRAIS